MLSFQKTRVPALGTKVWIRWTDCFTKDPWTDLTELLTLKQMEIETLGWFIGKTPDGSWVVPTGLDGIGNGGGTWIIPQSLVREWSAL